MVVQHRLVIGIDGSGKSTLLDGLSHIDKVVTMEPTSSRAAREFKSRSTSLDVTPEFIAERRAIYLDLNRELNQEINTTLERGSLVVTTGSTLVTLVSHSLMSEIVSGSNEEVSRAVNHWVHDNEALKPDQIVFLHAPYDVIRQRIETRQLKGQTDEKFWGFNSPYFLSRYQETWHKVIGDLIENSEINCISLSSSDLTPSQMLQELA